MIIRIVHWWFLTVGLVLFSGMPAGMKAQSLIRNGSFEGLDPFYGHIPLQWQVCDSVSTPDIQPISSDRPAYAGSTYLGLVARVRTEGRPEWNGTVEAVYQELADSLIPGQDYRIRIYLMYDPNHKPSAPLPIGSAKLRIYIGNQPCDESRLLWQSVIINHQNWQPYNIRFKANCGERFLRLQADIADESYDLNYIMIDSVSLVKTSSGTQPTINCSDVYGNGSNGQGGSNGQSNGNGQGVEETLCPVFLPTAFSPDGDGSNDYFMVYPRCQITAFELAVMDRWGNMVFSSRNENDGWDGTFRGMESPPGVYSYRVILHFLDSNALDRKQVDHGTITLFR
ncbi:MAG: gliding motility-associated C-terminal domain-containing protein [Saprospiraceae bacterium]|nr:gliding motility-associated C-terminal domain-containing protein [Saprospiraceae bacterium]MCB9321081.1 gliding motility-associated C-terminal domain-containing protein [Lewinellaceae bacterium]